MPKRTPTVDVDDELYDPLIFLSVKERKFVEAYAGDADGNGTKAAELAGYTGSYAVLAQRAHTLLKKSEVNEALAFLLEHDPLVAGRVERLRFYTKVMRGEVTETRATSEGDTYEFSGVAQRLRACEKLSDIAGDFREKPREKDDELPTDLTVDELFELAGVPRPDAKGAN